MRLIDMPFAVALGGEVFMAVTSQPQAEFMDREKTVARWKTGIYAHPSSDQNGT